MTEKTPSDAEILELASHYWRDLDETESTTEIELVRAALAKWGQPVVAAAPDERADFECWQTDVLCRSLDALTQGTECPGEYDDMDVQHEWTAWQARAVLSKRVQPTVTGEPVSHQYLNRYGKWCDFIDKRHYDETILEGTWPIRALYTHPQPIMTGEISTKK